VDKLEEGLDFRHQPDVVQFHHERGFKVFQIIESDGSGIIIKK